MSDLPTIQQAICARTKAHCATCRNLAGGRPWRVELTAAVLLPADVPDFTCPLGNHWGYSPAPVAGALPDLAAQRLAVCRRCDEWNGSLCERQFPCGKCLGGWMKWLANLNSRCPSDRW